MRYLVRERVFSIGEDFWISDEHGERVFLVDGKALRLRETFELKDASGTILATVKKKLIAVRDTMEITHDGAVVATVRKAMISPLHHRSVIELADGSQLEAVGNVLDKEFDILLAGQPIAQVSRLWFRLRDTYGVDVAPGGNDALILAIAVCLDRIHHDEEEKQHRLAERRPGDRPREPRRPRAGAATRLVLRYGAGGGGGRQGPGACPVRRPGDHRAGAHRQTGPGRHHRDRGRTRRAQVDRVAPGQRPREPGPRRATR
jgi:uncharacterized protein YxjI